MCLRQADFLYSEEPTDSTSYLWLWLLSGTDTYLHYLIVGWCIEAISYCWRVEWSVWESESWNEDEVVYALNVVALCTAAIMSSKKEGLAVSELAMRTSYSEANNSIAPSEMLFETYPPPLSPELVVSKNENDTDEGTALLVNSNQPSPVSGFNSSSGSGPPSGSDREPLLSSGARASNPHACTSCTTSVPILTTDEAAVPPSEKNVEIDLENDDGSEATCRICLEAGGSYLLPFQIRVVWTWSVWHVGRILVTHTRRRVPFYRTGGVRRIVRYGIFRTSVRLSICDCCCRGCWAGSIDSFSVTRPVFVYSMNVVNLNECDW